MTILVVGLLLFLGMHSVRIFADGFRSSTIANVGERRWKLVFAIVSIVGLVLVAWGYADARQATRVLYTPPAWTRHLAALLTLPAFILIAAGNVTGTRLRARIGHPMVAGVKLWAFAHLIANGTVADVVLFGAFLAWAVVDFIVARRRDRIAGTVHAVGPPSRDMIAVGAGGLAWVVFGFFLHGPLIGVRPFG